MSSTGIKNGMKGYLEKQNAPEEQGLKVYGFGRRNN